MWLMWKLPRVGSGNLRDLLQGHSGRWSLLDKDAEERELSLIGLQQIDQKAHRPGESLIQAVYTFKDTRAGLEFLRK